MEQIMCDLATAAVASVIWEQTRMGGMCQVQWEFQVKWVMFSPAVTVFMCVCAQKCWGWARSEVWWLWYVCVGWVLNIWASFWSTQVHSVATAAPLPSSPPWKTKGAWQAENPPWSTAPSPQTCLFFLSLYATTSTYPPPPPWMLVDWGIWTDSTGR